MKKEKSRGFPAALTALVLALLMLGSCASAGQPDRITEPDTAKQTEKPAATAAESVTEEETGVMTLTSGIESTAAAEKTPSVLDGKKVIFIGNSMIYYGGVVTKGGYRSTDNGWFYRICQANGDKTTVIDCTYGSHHLYDFTGSCKTSGCDVGVGGDLLQGLDLSSFDYVFMSESGNNNANFVDDVKNVMARFTNPDTVFVYMCHTYSYDKGHTKVTGKLSELKDLGVIIADWGHICYDLYAGRVKNPKATVKYVKDTFVNNVSGDAHHPNPLAGYIAALTCYCAVTGKTAVGQSYSAREKIGYATGSVSYAAYKDKYYTTGVSNFTDVFDSPNDMEGIQGLIDKYVQKWK